jgi:hypothetical protein
MMKKTVYKGMIVACMLLFGVMGRAQTSSDPVGVWTFSIPDAPVEYSTGKAEFKKVDDKLTLEMIVDGNPGISFEVTRKDKDYVCRFVWDNFYMDMTLSPDGDNLKGKIAADDWEFVITMKPEKK